MTRHKSDGEHVILFTANFPYYPGEWFLETEITYLLRFFDRVIVVPTVATGAPRSLPREVEVNTSLSFTSESSLVRGWWRLRSAPAMLVSRTLRKELRQRSIAHYRGSAWVRMLVWYSEARQANAWLVKYLSSNPELVPRTLVYTYWLTGAALGAGWARRRFPRLRIASRAHGHDVYEERHTPAYLPFRRSTLESIDHVYVASENGASYLRRACPAYQARVGVARLGVRDPGFRSSSSADGVLRVVSCSMLRPEKRVGLLIEALGELAASGPEQRVVWHHLGGGALKDQLECLAGEILRAGVSWHFVGQIENEAVLDFYRSNLIDVFVNVSSSEGVPVSIMEAQACGIPVVATAVGGTPEIVDDTNGVLLPPDCTSTQVAAALRAFWCDADHVAAKRKLSRRTWARRSAAETNYATFCERLLRLRRQRDDVFPTKLAPKVPGSKR